uniref:glycosyltransferase n=1 Tax=Candidatus Planktophila sp. TaxID=2175601 RepID=UPI00404A592C
MSEPTVIMVTSNGIGAGHLIRASAIARSLKPKARPVIFSMAYSVVEVCSALGLDCEYVPSRDKKLMPKRKWDRYLRDRLVALIDETNASVVTFDGVVPYPGIVSAKFLRPKVNFVWIRRGMWQRKPQGLALGLQSKLMDYVIEPGDIAREADTGPTKSRKEALLTSPVSLYSPERTMTREGACALLGLDPKKPAVLINMGVGSTDLDVRVSAVIRGLQGWDNLQIVMPREPKDSDGNSLIPDNMTVKTVRYFPLADVLHAFDAAICAAGYNSVHEVIPAGIPTLLIANNRGTDDQFARAKWCADAGLTLHADNNSLEDIESETAKLQQVSIRQGLIENCSRAITFDGSEQISEILGFLLHERYSSLIAKRLHYQRFLVINALARSPRYHARRFVNFALRSAAIIFRTILPHNDLIIAESEIIFSDSRDFKLLDPYIRKQKRFEHLIQNASESYIGVRNKIVKKAYGPAVSVDLNEPSESQGSLKVAS